MGTSKKERKKIFVAMSGGVDSSVAAALLKKEGHEVIGVTMCFNITKAEDRRPSCCGAEGIQDAKRAAQILDIPHYVLNFAQEIEDYIIEDFVKEYIEGRTPNPCVRCNQFLKFGSLLQKIRDLGGEYLATGHYAKIKKDSAGGVFQLKKGKDQTKEQSYFLYGIKKDVLPFLVFPLGDLTKQEVRQIARDFHLVNAEKPGSQDICFVSERGYEEFLKERVGEAVFASGPIKDAQGNIVGEHKGIARHTIGQRDGLGVALGRPVYIYKIDKENNTVYAGDEEHLYQKALKVKQLNFVSIDFPKSPIEVMAKIRYNQSEVPATLFPQSNNEARVEFQEPQRAITPGQSAVFYDHDIVLGGGIIEDEKNQG